MGNDISPDDYMLLNVINNLKNKRKIFHSEADLQFSIGWEIGLLIEDHKIRFEQPWNDKAVDIIYYNNDERIAFELKYKTARLSICDNGEDYNLKDHAAIDIGRFDVLKDVSRVETFIKAGFASKGFVLFITNCSSYWVNSSYSGSDNAHDKEFRLIQDKIIHGSLKWPDDAKETTYGIERIKGLDINGEYKVSWEHYSEFSNIKNGMFKYLLFEVLPE